MIASKRAMSFGCKVCTSGHQAISRGYEAAVETDAGSTAAAGSMTATIGENPRVIDTMMLASAARRDERNEETSGAVLSTVSMIVALVVFVIAVAIVGAGSMG